MSRDFGNGRKHISFDANFQYKQHVINILDGLNEIEKNNAWKAVFEYVNNHKFLEMIHETGDEHKFKDTDPIFNGTAPESNPKNWRNHALLFVGNEPDEDVVRKCYIAGYTEKLKKQAMLDKMKEDDEKEKVLVEERSKRKIDKESVKYKVCLEFVNILLSNIGKDKINDLLEFKNIDRLLLIEGANEKVLRDEKIVKLLYGPFSKKNTGYYRETPNWTMNILRGIVREVGLEMEARQQNITKNSVVKTHFFYSII